jgi:hypothetical protein
MALVVVIIGLATSGCGALFHGTTTQVAIVSRPTGAHTWVDGTYVGVTPIRVMLPSRDAHDVVVKKEGYRRREIRLLPRVTDGYIAMDAFFMFPWSLVLDALTQAWIDTSPGRLRIRLQRGEDPPAAPVPPRPEPSPGPTPGLSPQPGGAPSGEPLRPPGY